MSSVMQNVEPRGRSTLLEHMREFAKMAEDTARRTYKLPPEYSGVSRVIVSGMGGSGIAGDVLQDVLEDQLEIPILTVKGPTLPAYANRDSLFISVSYSGETLETLTALRVAFGRGCKIVGISSGGTLQRELEERGLPHVRLPTGYKPRETLPFFLFSILGLFSSMGWLKVGDEARNLERKGEAVEELGKRIAAGIGMRPVAIYSRYASVGHRFKSQLNENTKAIAKYDVAPEMCHNEINSWEDLSRKFKLVFMRDAHDYDQVYRMLGIVEKLLDSSDYVEVDAEGETRLERILHLIWVGDFASYYLAKARDVDPDPIVATDFLKRNLAENR